MIRTIKWVLFNIYYWTVYAFVEVMCYISSRWAEKDLRKVSHDPQHAKALEESCEMADRALRLKERLRSAMVSR